MPGKKKRIEELEKVSNAPGFWNDNQRASLIMRELENLQKEVAKISALENEINELLELAQIISSADNSNAKEKKEIKERTGELEKMLAKLEFQLLFSGEYDRNDAIVSIHSGAGGVDAQDWAEMLWRMYLRFAEQNNFKVKIDEETRGQEAGIKSATFEISGAYAYGKLKSEAGVHRLVRLSPFNANNLRQTSFALVEVLPVIAELAEVSIDAKDLRVDVFRSSGPGGQGVNTTDSAVRIIHIPTGLMAASQNERSQLQNKEQALKILKAKLHKKYLEEKERKRLELKGGQISVEWGSQIRSYIIHPYKLVKDHRTKFETTDVESVLGGAIDNFIEAYLKSFKK